MAKKLTVGDIMPNYTFNTAWKDGQSIKSVIERADKTVFWVLRYIGCPLCRLDVQILAEEYEKFKAKGAQVIVVMQSDAEHIRKEFKEDGTVPFDIVCDNEMVIYKDLVIEEAADMQAVIGNDEQKAKLEASIDQIKKYGFQHGDYEGNEQQLPALFITDKTGKVLYAHYAEALRDMPDIDEVVAML